MKGFTQQILILKGVMDSDRRGEPKQQPSQEKEEEEAEVDEFFALIQRIRETNKQFPALRKPNSTNSLNPLKAGSSNPARRLSFDWEDFCSAGTGTRDVKPCTASKAQPVMNLNSKRGVKRQSASLEEGKNGDSEMPDLNLPFTPPVLQLFH